MKSKKAEIMDYKVIRLINQINKLLDKKGRLHEKAYKLINDNWEIWLKCLQAKEEHPYLEEVVNYVGYMTALTVFKKYVPYLEKLLAHENEDIRCEAIVALGIYGNKRHIEVFLKLIKTDKANRWMLCSQISNFPERYEDEIISALTWVIKQQNQLDQYMALQSINRWNNPKAFKAILWASKNAKDKECRELAKKLLSEAEK